MFQAEGWTNHPPWVLRRAERIAAQRRHAAPAPVGPPAPRRLVAALTFDSQVNPQFARPARHRTQVRRLLFQAENIEVDLEMSPPRSPSRFAWPVRLPLAAQTRVVVSCA